MYFTEYLDSSGNKTWTMPTGRRGSYFNRRLRCTVISRINMCLLSSTNEGKINCSRQAKEVGGHPGACVTVNMKEFPSWTRGGMYSRQRE